MLGRPFWRKFLRPLLLTAVLWLCTSETVGATVPPTDPPDTTTTSSTTIPAVEPAYDEWTPCTSSTVTVDQWANCSTAYNIDRMRQTVTVGLYLLVALGVVVVLLVAFRS